MAFISNYQTLTGVAPVFQWAEVGNVAADIIVLKYGKNPDPASVPGTGDFTIAGTAETITDVTMVGDIIQLTMTGNLIDTDVLTVSYTKGSNPIQDTSGNESVNLVTESIVNNI